LHIIICHNLKLQSVLTSRIGQDFYAAMKKSGSPVKYNFVHFGFLGFGSNFFANPGSFFGHRASLLLADSSYISQSFAFAIINNLSGNMHITYMNAETWTLGCTNSKLTRSVGTPAGIGCFMG
jgi:hypothetical protein